MVDIIERLELILSNARKSINRPHSLETAKRNDILDIQAQISRLIKTGITEDYEYKFNII